MVAGQGSGRPAQGGIRVPISATNDLPIHGFSASLWFPAAQLSVTEATYAGTVIETLAPEYFDSAVDPVRGNVSLAVIFEILPPYDVIELPANPDAPREIAAVIFDVSPIAVPGLYPLELRDGPGEFPIKNIFTNLGTSIFPAVEDGSFEILPLVFRRGYVNQDVRVDISDAIFLFGYIFLGSAAPECMAAADANGSGEVDLADGVWLLGWIFRGTAPPPEPFDACGEDPRGYISLSCLSQPACQ
jgi:hypothetical protein